MITRIILGGFGGQGILMMGYVLATASMYEGRHVTCLPAYGAEMRGGTANCTVTVSDEPIASPVALSYDIAILMNGPSLLRFENNVRPDGIIFFNSDLIKSAPQRTDVVVVGIPANTIAKKIGNLRIANMAMCGAVAEKTGLVPPESIINSVEYIFANKGPKIFEINTRAIREGALYIKNR
ncbi:MAG: 2-oxoacid:acceptor oxidoreductase family protein [Pseudomonadota bacterium]